jgi:SAM-dependent methyltransferase
MLYKFVARKIACKLMLSQTHNTDWFEDWFNSPYYHILYKDRDDNEAKLFISHLIDTLQPHRKSKLLDIACGKGRHAIYMNKLGYDVDAYDLSTNSINAAKQYETKNLRFFVNDIRNPLNTNQYNYAFNLFTSFGYFDKEEDNYKAIKAIVDSLIYDGLLVIDFMNIKKVIENLIVTEEKVIDGLKFTISKKVEKGFIIKEIIFSDKGKNHRFLERVKAISYDDFKNYFDSANLKIINTYGDYSLNSFNIETSDRLILIAKKVK